MKVTDMVEERAQSVYDKMKEKEKEALTESTALKEISDAIHHCMAIGGKKGSRESCGNCTIYHICDYAERYLGRETLEQMEAQRARTQLCAYVYGVIAYELEIGSNTGRRWLREKYLGVQVDDKEPVCNDSEVVTESSEPKEKEEFIEPNYYDPSAYGFSRGDEY